MNFYLIKILLKLADKQTSDFNIGGGIVKKKLFLLISLY